MSSTLSSASGFPSAIASTLGGNYGEGSNGGLQEVIIGYRRPNVNQKQYLSKVLAQTRQELMNKDMGVKVAAAQKLLFLVNEGGSSAEYQWAIFNVIELMGSS